MALPFVFVAFIINFPAGLLVYWITTNLWTIVQQFIVRRTVGPINAAEARRRRRRPEPRRWAPASNSLRAIGEAEAAKTRGAPSRRARRRPPPPPPQEEEALRPPPLMTEPAEDPAERLRSCSSEVVEALGLDADGRGDGGRTRRCRHASRATTSGCSIGRHGQTIDALQHLASADRAARIDGEERRA